MLRLSNVADITSYKSETLKHSSPDKLFTCSHTDKHGLEPVFSWLDTRELSILLLAQTKTLLFCGTCT